ncbi:MAG: head completion/stabilization protein [Tolumonas sp.]
MSFISVAQTQTSTAAAISSHPFWPDITPDAVREAQRIDGTVTDARLIHAIVSAIASVNTDLRVFRQTQQTAGIEKLADVEAEIINNESALVFAYRRAVYATAHANLIERYRNFDSTTEGNKQADQLTLTADDLYRDARFAIRDILGVTHVTVELI